MQKDKHDFHNNTTFGKSAVMSLSGEDILRSRRGLLQNEQMRGWILDQMSEKQDVGVQAKAEDARLSEYLCSIEGVRDQIEEEEDRVRQEHSNLVRLSSLVVCRFIKC